MLKLDFIMPKKTSKKVPKKIVKRARSKSPEHSDHDNEQETDIQTQPEVIPETEPHVADTVSAEDKDDDDGIPDLASSQRLKAKRQTETYRYFIRCR